MNSITGFPPKKVVILSDGNEMEFLRIINDKKEKMFVYKYSKSESKMNKEVTFSERELKKQLKNFFKEKRYEN